MKRVPRLMAIRALGAEGELERWLAELASTAVDSGQVRCLNASERAPCHRVRGGVEGVSGAAALGGGGDRAGALLGGGSQVAGCVQARVEKLEGEAAA